LAKLTVIKCTLHKVINGFLLVSQNYFTFWSHTILCFIMLLKYESFLFSVIHFVPCWNAVYRMAASNLRTHKEQCWEFCALHYRAHSSQSCFITDINQIVRNQINFLFIFIFLHTEILHDEKQQKSTSQAVQENKFHTM
jgi:hypothetical protein